MPTTPHSAAGWRLEPPGSDPGARGATPAAPAAALPPLDPPGTREWSCGLRVGPKAEFSVELPMANSSRFVLPTTIAPAAVRRCTTVASYGGRQPSRIRDEHVVGMPRVHMLSLSATGTPASGPGSSPAATRAPMAAAAARAPSAGPGLGGQDQVEGVQFAVGGREAAEVLLDDGAGGGGTGAHAGGDLQ